jgi:predicted metal-dependent hydrolase
MTSPAKQSSTPHDIIIEPRRPEFDFATAPKYWLGDPFATHFMNALSSPRNWGRYFRFIAWSMPIFFRGAFKYFKKDYLPWNDNDKKTYTAYKKKLPRRFKPNIP